MDNNIVYNFDINSLGYDFPAFIKNPDYIFSQNILNLLKITDKKWLQNDQEYHIVNYEKSKITPDLVRTSGLFRSLVHSDGNILAFSPPKSINECEFMSNYPPYDCYAEEIIDGTMINLFYDKHAGGWEIFSKSKFGANCFFFNKKETFRYLFFEVCKSISFDYTSLPKENCYSFVFQHPKNRIVVPIKEMKLYLIAAYQINNADYSIRKLENEDLKEIIKTTQIERPKTYNFETYDDLEILIAEMNKDYKETGVMLYHRQSGMRSKIRNPNYEFVRGLRGNQAKLQYRYLELRQRGNVAAYLRYFPEALPEFTKFKKQIHAFTEDLHTHYINCYIKKIKPLLEFEEKFRTHMFNVHQIYKKKAEGKGKIITKTDVIIYVNTLPEALLMASLNSLFRNKEE